MMNMFQMEELLLLFYSLSVSLVLNDESSFFCINRYHILYFCIETLADEVDGWNERSAALVSSKPALATGFTFGRLDRFDCFA